MRSLPWIVGISLALSSFLLEQVGVLTGPEAFRPLDQGGCSLVDTSKKD